MRVRSRVAAAAAVVLSLAAVSGFVMMARSGWRPDPVVMLDVPAGRVAGGVAIDDSVVVVLTEETGDFRGRTTLVRLDAATGAEQERVELADWSALDDVATVDGDLVVRLRGRLPDVPAVEVAWPDPPSLTGEFWLVVIDGPSLTPLIQYQLPPFDLGAFTSIRTHEPLVVIDGVYWLLGAGVGRGRIDLRTGESFFENSFERGSIRGVIRRDDRLIIVESTMVSVQDAVTGANVASFRRDDVAAMAASPAIFFRPHEGAVWVAHAWNERAELPLRFDPEDGITIDDRPSTNIPDWIFESGGFRWELIRNAVIVVDGSTPAPDPDDRWRQVDPASNEVLAEFRLGQWQPRFATPGHLWVTRERSDGSGLELARRAIDQNG